MVDVQKLTLDKQFLNGEYITVLSQSGKGLGLNIAF